MFGMLGTSHVINITLGRFLMLITDVSSIILRMGRQRDFFFNFSNRTFSIGIFLLVFFT